MSNTASPVRRMGPTTAGAGLTKPESLCATISRVA